MLHRVITRRRLLLVLVALLTSACGGATGANLTTTTSTSTTTSRPGLAGDPVPACPRRWGSPANAPLNPAPARAGLADILVPPGPTVLSVCRYAGLNQSVAAGTLERSAVVTGPPLDSLVAYVDGPTWPVVPAGTAYGCPLSEGRTDLLVFAYPTGPDVSVSVDIGGCSFASNGERTVRGSPIGDRLAPLVGTD